MVSGASEADAAIYEPVPQLVPGRFKEIRVFRDRLVVVGESTGTSLLVLPIEFSHCLDVSIATGSGARVLRANINQTALLFSGAPRSSCAIAFRPGISAADFAILRMRAGSILQTSAGPSNAL
jgi:hypothetical protein